MQTSRTHFQCLLGWCLRVFWAAARSGCSLLYTQVVWFHCKPKSAAGFLPFWVCRERTGENTAEENTPRPRPAPCFRQPPGVGWLSVCPACCSEEARRITAAFEMPAQLAHSRLSTCREKSLHRRIFLYICINDSYMYAYMHTTVILFVLSAEQENDPSWYLIFILILNLHQSSTAVRLNLLLRGGRRASSVSPCWCCWDEKDESAQPCSVYHTDTVCVELRERFMAAVTIAAALAVTLLFSSAGCSYSQEIPLFWETSLGRG